MKRFALISIVLIIALAGMSFFANERWGGQPSWVQSTVVGSNNSLSNKSVGLDPVGCFGYTYSTVQMTAVEQGERDGAAGGLL